MRNTSINFPKWPLMKTSDLNNSSIKKSMISTERKIVTRSILMFKIKVSQASDKNYCYNFLAVHQLPDCRSQTRNKKIAAKFSIRHFISLKAFISD